MNTAVAAAGVILDELLRCGVTDVVLSPGSRSAPLALAAAEAEREGVLQLHVRVDERSAGYTALGLSRTTGAPTVVVCTSGTAVANLLPAVIEAEASDVPLIIVTADRPPELRGVGANQTIAQPGIFGGYLRAELDLETPIARVGVGRYWRSSVSQLVAAATSAMDPGPVHLNVPLRAPLVATSLPADDFDWDRETAGRSAGLPWTLDGRLVSVAGLALDSVLEQLGRRPGPLRGVVVVGDLPTGEPYPSEATILAESMNWPLLCEPSGNAHDGGTVIAHGSVLLAAPGFLDTHTPDVVVTVGRVGLSRAVDALIASAAVHIAVDPRAARSPLDPLRTADVVVSAVPAPAEACRADDAWTADWLHADDTAEECIGAELAAAPFSGPAAAREVWTTIGDTGLLVVGSSWSARHVDALMPVEPMPPLVLANRGVSGIDGLVSTAWGAALGYQRPGSPWDEALDLLSDPGNDAVLNGGPAVALIGDLAFLYDGNGMLVPPGERRPDLVIVVVDNDGGGIFSMLEQAEPDFAEDFERVFGTPTGRDCAALAAAAQVPCVTVTSLAEFSSALAAGIAAGGVKVIVAAVGDRASEAALLRRINERVAAEVER